MALALALPGTGDYLARVILRVAGFCGAPDCSLRSKIRATACIECVFTPPYGAGRKSSEGTSSHSPKTTMLGISHKERACITKLSTLIVFLLIRRAAGK